MPNGSKVDVDKELKLSKQKFANLKFQVLGDTLNVCMLSDSLILVKMLSVLLCIANRFNQPIYIKKYSQTSMNQPNTSEC